MSQSTSDHPNVSLRGQTLRARAGDGPLFAENLDIWNIRQEGDWVDFEGNLPSGSPGRGYRRNVDYGPIFARNHAPLYGLFTIGGQRAGAATQGQTPFPYHLFTTGDDIGHVGMGGVQTAVSTDKLGVGRERTTEALVGETLLAWRQAHTQSMPLIYARTETDSSASLHALSEGKAIENLGIGVQNWLAAADALGKGAELLAVVVDFLLEDLSQSNDDVATGMLSLLDRLNETCFSDLAGPPRVMAIFDSGTQQITEHPGIAAQWQLEFDHGTHDFTYAAPGYMFELDEMGWLTDQGRLHKAEIIAATLSEMAADNRWRCPMISLAEYEGNMIRVTCQSNKPLVIDGDDPFSVGAFAGFRLIGDTGGTEITQISIDPNDVRVILIKLSGSLRNRDVKLGYAFGAEPDPARKYAANAGALRDEWALTSQDGSKIHRWALPACLPITGI